jgi:hypothetical protein
LVVLLEFLDEVKSADGAFVVREMSIDENGKSKSGRITAWNVDVNRVAFFVDVMVPGERCDAHLRGRDSWSGSK